jgi:mRNA interferase RelE/StbE
MSRSRKSDSPGPRPAPRRYDVQLSRAAERSLAGLSKTDQGRIVARLRSLAENPRPSGVKKLEGAGDLYRIRSGDYRILYQIEDARLVVFVVDVGNRRDIYRSL